jgi:hypothetical protein
VTSTNGSAIVAEKIGTAEGKEEGVGALRILLESLHNYIIRL